MKKKLSLDLLLIPLLLLITLPAFAQAIEMNKTPEMVVQAVAQDQGREFVLEQVWEIDPGELNPARAHWLIKREVSVLNLRPRVVEGPGGNNRFGVEAAGVSSQGIIYLRTDSTCEGRQAAASQGWTLWSDLLKRRIYILSLMLKKVEGIVAETVMDRGRRVYLRWLEETENEWRAEIAKLACSSSVARAVTPSTIVKPTEPEVLPPVLARAPVRIWNGLYVIRAELVISGKGRLGQFLLDTSTPRTLVSPSWLALQGVSPVIYIDQDARLLSLNSPMGWTVGKKLWIDDLKISGTSSGLAEVWVSDTEVFSPPESVSQCCDGILGADFLRKYTVEFVPHMEDKHVLAGLSGAAVILHPLSTKDKPFYPWTRPWHSLPVSQRSEAPAPSASELPPSVNGQGINSNADWITVDVTFNGNQELVLDCYPYFNENLVKTKTLPGLTGVRLSTHIEEAGVLHTPWVDQIFLKKKLPNSINARLACGDAQSPLVNLPRVSLELAQHMTPLERNSPLHAKTPGLTLGMDFFGKLNWILDLARAKIWIMRDSMEHYESQNFADRHLTAPLELEYVINRLGDRILKVTSIESDVLKKQGLKVGMIIGSIDDQSVDGLDQWEIDRRIQGIYGTQLTLKQEGKAGKVFKFTH